MIALEKQYCSAKVILTCQNARWIIFFKKICPFSPKKPRFLEKQKNRFCHFLHKSEVTLFSCKRKGHKGLQKSEIAKSIFPLFLESKFFGRDEQTLRMSREWWLVGVHLITLIHHHTCTASVFGPFLSRYRLCRLENDDNLVILSYHSVKIESW